jgi:hypothetical protein
MNTVLANPSLKEIAQELDGRDGESYLNNQAERYVGRCNCGIILRTSKKAVWITPGDRADIILGHVVANEYFVNYPSISVLF